jgi:uncharacterized protein (TIGR02996 family)
MVSPALDPKLVAEIVARPLDDAPRLVLADALLERNDPRGFFIVGQCRLAETGLSPGERARLKTQCDGHLRAHGASWFPASKNIERWVMRRGFVDEVEAESLALVEERSLFASEPITRLTIQSATSESIEKLAEGGAFGRVLRLTIRGTLRAEAARHLARAFAARTTPLVSLNLGSTSLAAVSLGVLLPSIGGCRALALTGNPIGDEGATAIAKAKTSSALEALYLTDCGLSDEGLEAIAGSSNLGALGRLAVGRNEDISEDGLRMIAKSKKLRRLRWLEYDDDGYQRVVVRGRS